MIAPSDTLLAALQRALLALVLPPGAKARGCRVTSTPTVRS